MSIFDNKEQLIQKDAEFLSKLHQLVNDVYGVRNTPFEDGMVIETLLAAVAQHQAGILLMVGGTSVDEGYALLETNQQHAEKWLTSTFKHMVESAFEASLVAFNASAPQSIIDERELIRQELDLDMQTAIAETVVNTKTLAS